MSSGDRTFLFIHGAWHDRRTWDRVVPLLEAQGFRTRAIDLPGAGVHAKYPESYRKRPFDASAFAAEMSPNAGVTQADRTRAVVAEIDALGGGVLVGHSLGGLTVTSVGEAAAERLIALVYVCAFMTPPGQSANDVSQHAVMAAGMAPSVFCADADAVGAMRINPASEDAAYRARLTETFFGDAPGAEAARFIETLHCDEPVGVAREPSPATIGRFGRVPRHYIRCLADRAIPLAAQDFMIASVDSALGSKTHVQTLWASHSPFLSQPDKLAAALIAAIA
jgi:pimeloyl-ACP methyl ester carboxylesterase